MTEAHADGDGSVAVGGSTDGIVSTGDNAYNLLITVRGDAKSTEAVDRRVVLNPTRARALLDAVGKQGLSSQRQRLWPGRRRPAAYRGRAGRGPAPRNFVAYLSRTMIHSGSNRTPVVGRAAVLAAWRRSATACSECPARIVRAWRATKASMSGPALSCRHQAVLANEPRVAGYPCPYSRSCS